MSIINLLFYFIFSFLCNFLPGSNVLNVFKLDSESSVVSLKIIFFSSQTLKNTYFFEIHL